MAEIRKPSEIRKQKEASMAPKNKLSIAHHFFIKKTEQSSALLVTLTLLVTMSNTFAAKTASAAQESRWTKFKNKAKETLDLEPRHEEASVRDLTGEKLKTEFESAETALGSDTQRDDSRYQKAKGSVLNAWYAGKNKVVSKFSDGMEEKTLRFLNRGTQDETKQRIIDIQKKIVAVKKNDKLPQKTKKTLYKRYKNQLDELNKKHQTYIIDLHNSRIEPLNFKLNNSTKAGLNNAINETKTYRNEIEQQIQNSSTPEETKTLNNYKEQYKNLLRKLKNKKFLEFGKDDYKREWGIKKVNEIKIEIDFIESKLLEKNKQLNKSKGEKKKILADDINILEAKKNILDEQYALKNK